MIAFRDFKPKQLSGGLFKVAQYETFDQVVEEANGWIQKREIRVVNVETVLLPESPEGDLATGTGALTAFEAAGFSAFRQVLRVWFQP